jgi:hypothetical protein
MRGVRGFGRELSANVLADDLFSPSYGGVARAIERGIKLAAGGFLYNIAHLRWE